MLKRLLVIPALLLATACAISPSGPVDPAVRRARMEALPQQGSCQPAEPEGARTCTIKLGSKEARVLQWRNLTSIRYRATDTAEPAFLNDMRRVLTTAGTPDIDRAMSAISSHARSGAMVDFTTACFPDGSTPPVNECFVMVNY